MTHAAPEHGYRPQTPLDGPAYAYYIWVGVGIVGLTGYWAYVKVGLSFFAERLARVWLSFEALGVNGGILEPRCRGRAQTTALKMPER